jgi:hypothetical protein
MYHRSREQHGKNQQARDEWSPTHTKTITHTLCKFIVEGLGDVAATFRKKVLGSWLFATVRRDKHDQERTRIHTNTVSVFKTYIVSRSTNRRRRIVEKEETKRSAAAGDNPKEMAAQQGSGRRLKPSARASRSFIISLVAPLTAESQWERRDESSQVHAGGGASSAWSSQDGCHHRRGPLVSDRLSTDQKSAAFAGRAGEQKREW